MNSANEGRTSGFGIKLLQRSEEVISEHDFVVPLLQIVANIYENHNNGSELVTSYAWPNRPHNPGGGLTIRAIGRGLEEGLPITFNYSALVLFTRWLGQRYKPYKWTKFQCIYTWKEGEGEREIFTVAEGNYTSYRTSGGLVLRPSAPDTQTA